MRHFALSLLLLGLASPALADSYTVPAPVTAVTVYPGGALLTRSAVVELQAGRHEVRLPAPGDFDGLPRIAASAGVSVDALVHMPGATVDPETLYSPTQRAAKALVEALADEIEEEEDAIAAERVSLEALAVELSYLKALRQPAEAADDPAKVRDLAALVRGEVARVLGDIASGERALRTREERLKERRDDLAAAEAAFARLEPPHGTADMLVLTVDVAEAQNAVFQLTEITGAAAWQVDYDIDLIEADAPTVRIGRKVMVRQWTGSYWDVVAMTLSTARPEDAVAPVMPGPDRASIYPPAPSRLEITAGGEAFDKAAPMEEPVLLSPEVLTEGVAVAYAYPEPVSIGSKDAALLALGTLVYAAKPDIHAAPRNDETAFKVASIVNDGPEPILPGTAAFHRDGELVGQGEIALVPAGDEVLLPFGPVEGLRLDRRLVRNETGDTGLIRQTNIRDQQIIFTVENLTGETQSLRAFYPLPFSEQEDLEIELNVTSAPDETDYDGERGVSVWNMTLAPGETQSVEIDVRLRWPEGQVLRWYP